MMIPESFPATDGSTSSDAALNGDRPRINPGSPMTDPRKIKRYGKKI